MSLLSRRLARVQQRLEGRVYLVSSADPRGGQFLLVAAGGQAKSVAAPGRGRRLAPGRPRRPSDQDQTMRRCRARAHAAIS